MSRFDRTVLGLISAAFAVGAGWATWTGDIPDWLGIGLVSGLLLLVYFLAAGPLLTVVYGEVLLALVPLLVIAAGAIWAIVVYVPASVTEKPTLITGAIIAFGWIATWMAGTYRNQLERRRNRREVMTALRAEIFTALEVLDGTDWRKDGIKTRKKIKEGGDDPATRYHPFVGTESPPVIFESVSESLNLLSERTVNPVIRFYAAMTDLSVLAKDFRDPEFAKLAWKRRAGMHLRLTDNRIAALEWALEAILNINIGLKVEKPEAINRRGANGYVRIVREEDGFRVRVDPAEAAAS